MQILKPVILCCMVLSLALGLGGCDDLSYLGHEDGVLVLQPPAGSDPQKVLLTLKGRFEDFRPSVFSSVQAKIEDGRMHFLFRRGAPEPSILGTLMMQRGLLTAKLDTGELLYSNDDIVDANTVLENGVVYLKLVVTDEAAQRIADGTKRNIGKVVHVMLDGFNIFNTTISEPFSKNFQLSASYPFRDVQVIQALLDHGSLPGPIGLISTAGLFEPAKTETKTDNTIENPGEISADKVIEEKTEGDTGARQ
ncbi:MAG TPA: hypothetical protein VFX02_05535 [Gammaproteobacteria bacterium]|nr:hypothetical protein [Gammaproteobacteria bacterium]